MSDSKKEYNRLAKQKERARKKEKGIDPSLDFKKSSFINNIIQGKDIDINLIEKYDITLDFLKQNYDNLHTKVKIYYNNKNNTINKPFLLNIYNPTIDEFLLL